MAEETTERRNSARLAILELANMISVPMSLNAVVRLNVADAIWQGGSNTPLSAAEILSLVHPSGDPDNLQRILRMLSPVTASSQSTSISIAPNEGKPLNLWQTHHQDALMRAWPLVHEAVADPSTEPFVKANGEPAYSYYGKKLEMNGLMKKAMSGVSVPFMKAILDGYDGFGGVDRLVDVGGSAGDCLRMILQKHPNVKEGVNYDLPEVVAKAPIIPGVTHVGGDMFKSIPTGDAIFMKSKVVLGQPPPLPPPAAALPSSEYCPSLLLSISPCVESHPRAATASCPRQSQHSHVYSHWVLTTWTDEECKLIMKNSYKALPAGGKLIACEPVLPKLTDDSHRTRALLEGDIFVMTIYRAKGKHRTEEEYRQLGLLAGFPHFRALYIDYFYTLLEFQK
ncbi:cytochrome P450 superfamily protein [Actinidia rufa]|uniref:Cytochrome P450 superfamily protein n=1 Tax=Actinidia rufa TaxID=165716 RepID=A0A7J0E2D0_9ERIC|nr:cytochrome P450 superfamily protein [Actinidia rufa]